jgi:hypothetical protein
MAAEYDGDIFKHFYSGFFPKGIDVPTISPDATRESLTEIMDQTGLWAIGSVPEVRDDMVAQWKQLPAEYCVLIYHFAQQPKESVIEQLQVFMDEIEPALEEVINYEAG